MSPVALPSQTVALLHAPRDLRIESRTLWPPQYNHVQVAVTSTGLCGSDLHYYLHGGIGDFPLRAPFVLGHEAAGVVTAIGSGVHNLKVGQRVAIEAGIMCQRCTFCDQGRYNLCKGMRFCSSTRTFPHLDGTLQTRMNHPAHVLHPLPDNCSSEQASLAEPLSVVIHAAKRANLTAGQTVLVFGAGTIGLLVCAYAKCLGAARVVALDIKRDRLDFANANGFVSQTYCLTPSDSSKTSEEKLRRSREAIQVALKEFGQEDGFDVVFECSGADPCVQMSCYAAMTGGKVMLVGMGAPRLTVPLAAATIREVDVLGSFRYANTYPAALSLLASGKLRNIEKLITHRFALKDAVRAFETLARGKDENGNMVIKIMISPS